MSKLSQNVVAVGESGTAAHNLNIRTNLDGTFTVARGDGTALLTIDAAGLITPSQGFSPAYMPLGVGQTMKTRTAAQRAPRTPYVNGPRGIYVWVSVVSSVAGDMPIINIDGMTCYGSSIAVAGQVGGTQSYIPPGVTFSYDTNGGVGAFHSFRELS